MDHSADSGVGSKPEPLYPVAYLAELVEQQKQCPKHKLACPTAATATALIANPPWKQGNAETTKKPKKGKSPMAHAMLSRAIDGQPAFMCKPAHSWSGLPGYVVSSGKFNLTGKLVDPSDNVAFPFQCNRAGCPGWSGRMRSDRPRPDKRCDDPSKYTCGMWNRAGQKYNYKYVDPTEFSLGWEYDSKKSCQVPTCVMPLNLDHKNNACTGEQCGIAMRTCQKLMLLRWKPGGKCYWFPNSVRSAGKDVPAGGECSGSKGCGLEWRYNRRSFKQVMCFVTKSMVCEAQEFRSWNSSWPASEWPRGIWKSECVRRGLTGEKCTQYRQPLAFKCANVKHAWCENAETGEREDFEDNPSCQGLLSWFTISG